MKKFLLYYFLFLTFFFSLISSGVIDSQDGFLAMAISRNFYYTGKPNPPPYEYKEGKNIHMTSGTGLGFSLAMIPAVAITDVFYKIYNVKPPVHFPLENDWLILLMGSLTNIFFAAGLGVILYLYFIELNLSKKQALLMSLISIFATNLLSYVKNSFPHMMFTTFLVLSFFMVKKYFVSKKLKFLIFAGLSYGIGIIAYNGSFLLTVPSLIIYFILLGKYKINLKIIRTLFNQLLYFFIGLLPFLLLFKWYEDFRFGDQITQADPVFYFQYAKSSFFRVPISMVFEGLYGQLLSPGRSIFIYSPVLLIIIFFWHKITKNIKPELIVFILMALLYIPFYAIQFTEGSPVGWTGLWHGESSWGPRYLVPLIPFGLLVVGSIFQKLSKLQKYLLFYPSVIIGLYIAFLGVILPYQIKVYNIERSFNVNETEFTSYVYSNLIPRYTPIIAATKNLIKYTLLFPKTLDHGIYNVRLYDGINVPFNVGRERWRVIEGEGYISFDNSKKDPVKKMAFGLINHKITDSSSSATIQFTLNGHPLLEKEVEFIPTERKIIEFPIKAQILKDKGNELEVDVTFNPALKDTSQIFSIIAFNINNTPVNLETLDLPYYSSLGPTMVDAKYRTYGGKITDPWRFWDLHTQVYERTPDFWWVKSLYYWDYPKKAISLVVGLIIMATVFLGFKAFNSFNKLK